MKSVIQMVLKSIPVAALALTAFTPGLVRAEGGYNGPDLAGQAIPVAVDRAITPAQLESAVQGCSARIAHNIFVQVYKAEPKNSTDNYRDSGYLGATTSGSKVLLNPYFAPVNRVIVKQDALVAVQKPSASRDTEDPDLFIRLRWSTDTLALEKVLTEHGLKKDDATVELELAEMPRFSYSVLVPQPSNYDELGRPIYAAGPEKMVKDLTIQLPANYGMAVPMINRMSKHPTAVTLNMVDYVECLQAAIQK